VRGNTEKKTCEWCWEERPATAFTEDSDQCDTCLQAQRGMWKFRSQRTLGAMA
jgi:hypothetical protein